MLNKLALQKSQSLEETCRHCPHQSPWVEQKKTLCLNEFYVFIGTQKMPCNAS